MNWFNSQSPSFIAGIKNIELRLQPGSPCPFCVPDLIRIINNPNIKSDAIFNISWSRVFETNGACQELNTTTESLNNLKSSGWNISGQMPSDIETNSENLTIEQLRSS